MAGKLRSFFRRLVKPAIMASIAAGVALSLVVTTPSNAHAAVILPPPILLGSGTMPLAEVVGTVSMTGPIGWGLLGLGVVAVGLIATQDYWLPYVKGAFGQPTPQKIDSPAAAGQFWMPGYQIMNDATVSSMTDGADVTVHYNYTPQTTSTNGWSQQEEIIAECKQRSTGIVKYDRKYTTFSRPNRSQAFDDVRTFRMCFVAGYTMTSFKAGGGGGSANSGSYSPRVDGTSGSIQFDSSAPNASSAGIYGAQGLYVWGAWIGNSFDPASPDTKYTATVECVRADGTKFNLSKTSTGADGALAVPACAASDPTSHATGKMDVVGTPPATSGAPAQTLLSRAAPAPPANQPLCDITKPGQPCKLAVYVDGKECVVGLWECANWTTLKNDPNQAPRISCQQGPYTLALSSCYLLERAYEVGGAPATGPNTDGDPSTRSDADPNGQTIPKTSTSTGTGTGTGTGTVPGVGGAPAPGDTAGADCFPNGWGMLNPAEWVLKPVGCALQSAFVPKTQTVEETKQRIQTKVDTVGFGTVTTAWVDTFDHVGGGSGCAGPTVNFNFGGVNQSLQPFNACSQPMATVAGITYAFSCIVIVLAGGLGMARAISSGFGFNFTLGKGSSD